MASPFTAPWLSASPTHPWRCDHSAALNRRAEPGRGLHAQSAGPAHPDDPGQGAPELAEGGRLRPALAGGDRHVPLQSCHWSRPSRPGSAGPEDRSPGRLRGAQPDDPARHAGVAAHRLKTSPATAARLLPDLCTKAMTVGLGQCMLLSAVWYYIAKQ